MSEVLSCLSIPEMKDFLEKDIPRILGTFKNDPLANGEELVLFTEKMCLMVSGDSFKEYYPIMWGIFKQQNDLSNYICKKVELIMCDNGGGILGTAVKFKLTFVKI